MSKIRSMFVGQGPSGLPEDRIVNVWHFTGAGAFADDEGAAFDRLVDFYTTLASGQTNTIGSYLSPWVARAAQIVNYDLESAKPRIPFAHPLTLEAALSTNGLPEEVAVCLSFEGVPPHTARRRGRVYIGPLTNAAAASTPANSTTPSRPGPAIIVDLTAAALKLGVAVGGIEWCIRSSLPTENFVPVKSGWVDNAFDTQRRRGPESTARTTFSVLGI